MVFQHKIYSIAIVIKDFKLYLSLNTGLQNNETFKICHVNGFIRNILVC